jgi:hypothetical protein
MALGNLIPSAWGLGFAGVLCLVGILCSLANTRLRVMAAADLRGPRQSPHTTLPLKLNIVAAIGVAVLPASGSKSRLPTRRGRTHEGPPTDLWTMV